jgi:transcriptional regulator with XRE-family HTH domain
MRRKRKPKTPKTPGLMRAVVADNVRELMELRLARHGDKVKVLAAKSGVSRSSVQRVLNAEYGASIDTLEHLARALGVPLFQLLVKRSP